MSGEAERPDLVEKRCCAAPHRLSVHDLHVHYGPVCAVEGVDFEIECGRSVGLLGPNGAGKSSLLKALAGLVKEVSGEIRWMGTTLDRRNKRHEFAYLPQRQELDWDFPISLRGMVEMGRYAHVGITGRFGPHDHDVVDAALEEMQLSDLRNRHIRELSGGQQQRAFIARALAQEAHVLLLDEPFNGLDKPSQERLAELIRDLVAGDRLVIASHHDLKTVDSIFDHALVLKLRCLGLGPSKEVMAGPLIPEAFGLGSAGASAAQ